MIYEPKAQRVVYGETLKELGAEYERLVVLDADVSASTQSHFFAKAYPDRFFNCGIAEGNMMAVAAGAAAAGLVPFASTFAMFAAGRAFEQVRNSIGYPHLNVKIGATHGGISVGEDGASHQCCEDFATMRSIPGMTIMSPSDDVEAKKMVLAAAELEGPVYMRFCRLATPVFHAEDYDFKVGKAEVLREGTDVAIIANGILVPEAMEAAETLAAEGISAHVINMHTIKPLDNDAVIDAAKRCGVVITVEEHSIIGGLGEAVASCLAESYPTKVIRIGVNDEFGHSGPAVALLKAFGLSAENIVKKAKAAVGSKENDALTNF
jgi:transketolase